MENKNLNLSLAEQKKTTKTKTIQYKNKSFYLQNKNVKQHKQNQQLNSNKNYNDQQKETSKIQNTLLKTKQNLGILQDQTNPITNDNNTGSAVSPEPVKIRYQIDLKPTRKLQHRCQLC